MLIWIWYFIHLAYLFNLCNHPYIYTENLPLLQLMNNPELLRQLMENPMMQVSSSGHLLPVPHIITHRSLLMFSMDLTIFCSPTPTGRASCKTLTPFVACLLPTPKYSNSCR